MVPLLKHLPKRIRIANSLSHHFPICNISNITASQIRPLTSKRHYRYPILMPDSSLNPACFFTDKSTKSGHLRTGAHDPNAIRKPRNQRILDALSRLGTCVCAPVWCSLCDIYQSSTVAKWLTSRVWAGSAGAGAGEARAGMHASGWSL